MPDPRDIPRRPRRGRSGARHSNEILPRTRASLATRRRRRRSPPPSRRGKAAGRRAWRRQSGTAPAARARRSARVLRRSGTTETEIRRDSRDSTPIPSPFASPGRRRTRGNSDGACTRELDPRLRRPRAARERRTTARHRDARESIHHQSTRSNRGRVVPTAASRKAPRRPTACTRAGSSSSPTQATLGLLLDRRACAPSPETTSEPPPEIRTVSTLNTNDVADAGDGSTATADRLSRRTIRRRAGPPSTLKDPSAKGALIRHGHLRRDEPERLGAGARARPKPYTDPAAVRRMRRSGDCDGVGRLQVHPAPPIPKSPRPAPLLKWRVLVRVRSRARVRARDGVRPRSGATRRLG